MPNLPSSPVEKGKRFDLGTMYKAVFGSAASRGFLFKLAVYVILIGISYVFLYPLIKMITMSFMSTTDLLDPEVEWLPKTFNFNTFKIAFHGLKMPRSLWNSIWFSTTLGVLQTAVAALTGFAFARFQFRGRNFWFIMLLVSFIIPLPIVMIPRRMMFTSFRDLTGIKLVGTVIPQIVLTALGQGVNNAILVLIFHNFFKMIPLSLDEAARVDGATSWQVFWHIFIKMSLPIITTVFLFSFVWNWNETYVTSLLLSTGLQLLPGSLGAFDNSYADLMAANPQQVRLNESFKMAATLVSIIPLLILYAFAQQQFIEGIERTGITGE